MFVGRGATLMQARGGGLLERQRRMYAACTPRAVNPTPPAPPASARTGGPRDLTWFLGPSCAYLPGATETEAPQLLYSPCGTV